MLGRVVVENGVKKLVPLTADCGSGNPVGTVIAVYSNKVPNGYLPCNGVAFDTAQFPVLYALLQDDHTPDLRECTLVGIGTSDRTMGAHDVYTLGEFKDDQLQDHRHKFYVDWSSGSSDGMRLQGDVSDPTAHQFNTASGGIREGRTGTTTHGKQVGVNWCIKATSGINENQADNVLNILQPVDTVAVDNLHSVTSNAVSEYVDRLIYSQSVACEAYDPNTMPSVIASITLPEDNTVRYMVTATLGYNNSNPEFLAILNPNGILNDIATKSSKYGDFTITTNTGQLAVLKVSAIYAGGVTVKVRGASKVASNNTVNIYIRKIIRE